MFKHLTLDNGINIGLYRMTEIKSVSIQAMLFAGPVIEDSTNNGGSHFLEHLLLAGNQRYPNKKDFAEYLETLGISYNGHTSVENMYFTLDVPYTNCIKAIDFLKSILFEPIFDEEIIEKERKVVLEEIQDKINYPNFKFFYKTLEKRFKSKKHPLAQMVGGTPEVINGISKNELIDLYEKIVVPSNLFISIVGNIDPEKVENSLKDNFDLIKPKNNFIRPIFSNDDLSPKVFYQEEESKMNNVYASISNKGFGEDKDLKRKLSKWAFTYMFSGMRTSRLFQLVREKEALVYDISSSWDEYTDLGMFDINFECDYQNIDRIMEIVFNQLEILKKNNFTRKELNHVISYMNNRTLLNFSTSWNINNWIIGDLFNKRSVIMPEELIDIRNTIKSEDIEKITAQITDYSNLNIVLVGKLKDFNIFDSVKKLEIN